MLGGVDIIVTDHALEETDQRLFADSKHRSQRIRKKLIKRYGGEFRKVPCIFKVGGKIIAHPIMYAKIQQELSESRKASVERGFMTAYTGNPW